MAIPAYSASHVHDDIAADGSCCSKKPETSKNPKLKKYIFVMELVICVACTAFALYQAPLLLAAAIVVGAVYETTQIIAQIIRKKDEEFVKFPKTGECGASCSQSSAEQFIGRGAGPFETIAMVGYFFFYHQRHEPKVYVRAIGFWVGIRLIDLLYVRYPHLFKQSSERVEKVVTALYDHCPNWIKQSSVHADKAVDSLYDWFHQIPKAAQPQVSAKIIEI